MKKTLKYILGFALLFVAPCSFVFGQTEVPEKIGNKLTRVSVIREGAKIHEDASKGSTLLDSGKWMTPYVVIKRERDGNDWMIKVGEYLTPTEAKPVGWMRETDLLMRPDARKEEGIYVKAFPVTRFDDKNDRVEGAKLFTSPSEGGDTIGQELTQFGIYYVYDEHEDFKSGNRYFLMGSEPEVYDPQKPGGTIMGWVWDRKMHRWNTREAAEYDKSTLNGRSPTVIYETEGDIQNILQGGVAGKVDPLFTENPGKAEVSHTDQRYPIITKEREVVGQKYWNVAFIAEGVGASNATVAKLGGLTSLQPTVDIFFVIDGTGSMQAYKESVIGAVKSIQSTAIDYWQENFKNEQEPTIRFSVTMYKDYPSDANGIKKGGHYRRTPLEKRNVREISDFLESHDFDGGENQPAVFHALSSTILDGAPELDPSSFRAVFLIGDMGNLGVSDEPDANGHSQKSVLAQLKTHNFDFHAIQVATEYLSDEEVPIELRNALLKFKTQSEGIRDSFPQGFSKYVALSDPGKVADQIEEVVTDLLDQRYRTITSELKPIATGQKTLVGNTVLGQRAIQLMKQNGIDPDEFAQKKVSPFFEGWATPKDPATGKRQMKSVILMEKREVENLIAILGRLTTIKPENAQKGWMQALQEVTGDDIKLGNDDSPSALFKKHFGIRVKSGILSQSFEDIGKLDVAKLAEEIKEFQKKLFMLRAVVLQKDIEVKDDPDTGRQTFVVKGDKPYWFGHRGNQHAWLDREVFIP